MCLPRLDAVIRAYACAYYDHQLENETNPMTPLIGNVMQCFRPFTAHVSPVVIHILFGHLSSRQAWANEISHHIFPYISLDSDDVVRINWGMRTCHGFSTFASGQAGIQARLSG